MDSNESLMSEDEIVISEQQSIVSNIDYCKDESQKNKNKSKPQKTRIYQRVSSNNSS